MVRPLRQLGGTQRLHGTTLDVALVIPLHGSAGLFGPSCELCAQLAAEEVNADGGMLARELRFVVVDGARPPAEVADEVDATLADGAVDAVTGWHISAVRNEVAPRIAGRVPYVYTPLYEGGEHGQASSSPARRRSRQVLPALRWLRRNAARGDGAIVGDDYVWPRRTARGAARYACMCGAAVAVEMFVPLGTKDFTAACAASSPPL